MIRAGRFVFVFLLLPMLSQGADHVFCDDPEVVAEWERRAAEHREDAAIQMLHGLWIGLCAKIRAGSVEPDLAIDIFELERAKQTLERARDEVARPGATGT
jgi:hypothetical protein